MLDEEDRNIGAGERATPESGRDDLTAQRHGQPVISRLNGIRTVANATIQRKNDGDRVTESGQSARQVTADIGQTARLGEPDDFGTRKEDRKRGGAGHRFRFSERTGGRMDWKADDEFIAVYSMISTRRSPGTR